MPQMRRIAISMTRGGVAALLAAGGLRSANGQTPASPSRIVRDTTVILRIDGQKIALDSLRLLIRAFDEEPLSSMQSERVRQKLEAMMISFKKAAGAMGGGIVIGTPEGIKQFGGFPAKGWIGLTTAGVHNDVERPDAHFVQYVDYPPIVAVERQSPAQAAGILPGDTLIAYDGIDVVAHAINVTQLLLPEKKLGVTVRREGENRVFTLIVGRMPNAVFTRRLLPGDEAGVPLPDGSPVVAPRIVALGGEMSGGPDVRRTRAQGGQVFLFSAGGGVFGASMSEVGEDLARAFKIEQGVLVNAVPEDTPASRVGLKAGDVIVSVSGRPVRHVEDIRRLAAMNGDNHSVTLQIIRDKKARSITVR